MCVCHVKTETVGYWMACTPAGSDVKTRFNVQVTPCDAIMFEKLDTENQNYNKYTNSVGAPPPGLNSPSLTFHLRSFV